MTTFLEDLASQKPLMQDRLLIGLFITEMIFYWSDLLDKM